MHNQPSTKVVNGSPSVRVAPSDELPMGSLLQFQTAFTGTQDIIGSFLSHPVTLPGIFLTFRLSSANLRLLVPDRKRDLSNSWTSFTTL